MTFELIRAILGFADTQPRSPDRLVGSQLMSEVNSQPKQPPAKGESGFNPLVMFGVAIGFVVFIVLVANWPPSPGQAGYLDPAERIAKACEEQFGSQGQIAVNSCRIRIMTDRIAESERSKLDRAKRSSY